MNCLEKFNGSLLLARHREELVGKSIQLGCSFRNPVHKHRKGSCDLVGIGVARKERALVHGVVPEKSACIAELFHVRGKFQAQNLRSQTVPLSAQADAKALKRKAQHRAGTTRGTTDDGLSFHVRIANVVRHVFGWGNRREFGPHHFSLNPEGWFIAGNTSGDTGFLNVRQGECLKTVVDKRLLRELYVSGRIWNVIQLGKPFDQGAEDHLGFCAAVRARK